MCIVYSKQVGPTCLRLRGGARCAACCASRCAACCAAVGRHWLVKVQGIRMTVRQISAGQYETVMVLRVVHTWKCRLYACLMLPRVDCLQPYSPIIVVRPPEKKTAATANPVHYLATRPLPCHPVHFIRIVWLQPWVRPLDVAVNYQSAVFILTDCALFALQPRTMQAKNRPR